MRRRPVNANESKIEAEEQKPHNGKGGCGGGGGSISSLGPLGVILTRSTAPSSVSQLTA